MTFQSQRIAWYYFIPAIILFGLQLVFGLYMAACHMGFDFLHPAVPFSAARAIHLNLLVVWLLLGFMGATYYMIPEETQQEIWSDKLAYVQLGLFLLTGVAAIACFLGGYFEGRKFLEIPRPLDYLVVVDVLMFLGNVLMTVVKSGRWTTTITVLLLGLVGAALLYLPGMIWFDSQTLDAYFRWWVVHLWVEGVWELILGGIMAYLLIKLTGVDREVIEKWLYIIVGLTFVSGILGTGHHYYFIGAPAYWKVVGGVFSALEPLAFLGMAIFGITMMRRGGRRHPNHLALLWTVGCGIMAFVGAGFLGFAHTLPQANMYTHGTLVTAMHGHLAFWGAYAMIVFAVMSYAIPEITGRKLYDAAIGHWAFWTTNVAILGMTGAFAVAGVTQVYLERVVGIEFLTVQKELHVHFFGLLLAGSLMFAGYLMLAAYFFKHGLPIAARQTVPAAKPAVGPA